MKKLFFVFLLSFSVCVVFAFPLKIISCEPEQKVYNNLDKIVYSFEGKEDYAYIDRLNAESDVWAVYFHSFTGNARELFRSHIYQDLWIRNIREEKMGVLDMNIYGDSFMVPWVARSCHYMVSYIREKYGVKKFVFMGASMGGFCALKYAELYPRDVSCVIAVSPNSDMEYMFRDKKDFIFAEAVQSAKEEFFRDEDLIKKWNLYDNCRKLTMPVFLCHSRED
ncbi:MAG: alpha/beta fold hydrolase, partial [Armatimonadetes bacterium]|nr:alpha/beta fold hydrolase [Candidatus Hippobium faecium]